MNRTHKRKQYDKTHEDVTFSLPHQTCKKVEDNIEANTNKCIDLDAYLCELIDSYDAPDQNPPKIETDVSR